MGYQNSTQPSASPSYVGDGSVNTAMGETSRDEKKTPAWKEYFNRMGGFMGRAQPMPGAWGTLGSGIVSAIAALRKPKEK